jgi:sulfatase maturation enzyme AslB (radical SAM superfamily)
MLPSPPPAAHHRLEDILRKGYVQRLLGWLTVVGPDGTCLFERLCENYDHPDLPWHERWKWALPTWLTNLVLRRAKLDREMMKRKLFHRHPTVRALTLTARSIARHGLTAPQRFVAPLFVVWNITQACNLHCRHCYQNAGPRPTPDELTMAEKLRVVDEMAAAGVPFLAIAGGEPLACKDLWPVLERAQRRGLHLSLATNGTLLRPETVSRLIATGVKYVEVSVDSVDPVEHAAFRGRKGAWAEAIQGIKNSVAAGMRTGLAMCFTHL